MKQNPHIQKANKILATVQAELDATAKATWRLRAAIAERRDALLPLRERLRREVETNDDDNSKQAYQQCCATIARMDQQIAHCDSLHPLPKTDGSSDKV